MKFFVESIHFNWSLLEENPDYYTSLSSMTTYEKIDELYDMMLYFFTNEEYEKCQVIKLQIESLLNVYKDEIYKSIKVVYERNR